MKVFVGHSFSENLSNEYYELYANVLDIIYRNHHKIYVGGLFSKLRNVLPKYEDSLYCYSIEKYKSERINCPNCNYITVNDLGARTDALIRNTDMTLLLPGGSGTLEEFFRILETFKVEENNKVIYLLNYNNHYSYLLEYMHYLENNGFNTEKDLKYISVIDLEDLEKILKEGK